MNSETGSRDVHDASLVERLISSRNRDLALFLPFILGFTSNTNPVHDSQNPHEQTQENSTPHESRDRLILINPFTQAMVVLEGSSSSSLDSLLRDLLSKDGQSPASKASIEAMPSVQICEENCDHGECVICLEEWQIGEMAKEMPCMHKFHGECIEKWLKIRGSCPICRFKMPTDDDDDVNKKGDQEDQNRVRRRRRDIWVSFSFSRDTRNWDINQTALDESRDT